MQNPFIATTIMFAGNFAPRSWAFCDGQLMPIAQNTALFSILGTTFGGDGRTTYGLPDMRGRVAVHPGHGPGLSFRKLGQRSGLEETTVNVLTMPYHTHEANLTGAEMNVPVQSAPGEEDEANPAAGVLTNTGTDNFTSSGGNAAYNGGAGTQVAGTVSVQATGNGQAYNNMQPYLGVNFIIALFGIYPSRN
ncbi:hypothetical protein BFP97_01765 [Roseivirga sp. 4D4]|uniref:phage tail protein n=1 Tax=Roseivirga sp. 4D4 TaxID=1889784 RepID=UPI000853A7B1|nr:tail fiber protein [Roseivirga sp. 4D4]OEK00316.1 hypothetical protein BFP97_01765 [Roseivirga sp. 4D4]